MSIPTILSIISAFLAILSLGNVKRMHENYKAHKKVMHKAWEYSSQANANLIELLKIIDNSKTSDEIKMKYVIYLDYKNSSSYSNP